MEEGVDLQGFTPARAHLSLQEVYGEFPHHNNGTKMSGIVPDDATWKSCWRRLAVQSTIWYSKHPGKVGFRFTTVLDVELQGVLKWNYERPLFFAHVVLTKTLGACKAREIWSRINCGL